MITPLLKKYRHEIKRIAITILLAIIVIIVESILANNFKDNYAKIMFVIFTIIAYTNRKFISRFLAIVVIDILYNTADKFDLYMTSRIAGFYLSHLDMAFIIIFVLWFVQLYGKGLQGFHRKNSLSFDKGYPKNLSLPFIAIIFVFIIGMINGFSVDVGIKPILRHGKILLIYLAYFPLRSMLNKRDLVHLFSVLVFVMFYATLLTLYHYWTQGDYIEPSVQSMSEYEYFNPFYSTRVYAEKVGGVFDLLILPAASWVFILALYSRKHWEIYLFLIFFFLSGVIIAISRSYTIGHLIPLILIGLIHFPLLRTSKPIKHKRKIVFAAIMACVIIIPTLFFVFKNIHFISVIDRLGSLFGSSYGATGFNIGNMSDRMSGLIYGFELALENPFGSGFGAYVETDSSLDLSTLMYHSLPLYLFFTFGLVGGSVIVFAWISILFKALKQFRRSYGINSVIAGVVFSYILCQLIVGIGGNTLLRTDTLFPIACASLRYFPERKQN